MSSDEIKIGCLVFMIILGSKQFIPARVLARFPKLGVGIEILAGIVITVVTFFATTGK